MQTAPSIVRHEFAAVATSAPRTGAWIAELDGLRGIAVLLVAIHHFRPLPWFPEPVRAALGLGWVGVDLFFALSGFLITGILLDSAGTVNYYSAFYARRALRILPLYLAALVVFCWVLPAVGLARPADSALLPWYWLHVSNWKSAFGVEVPALSHFWSLAIEEQFYLVWPAVVALAGARRLPWICVAMALASAGARWVWMDQGYAKEFLYRLTPFRLESLALGGLLACAARGGTGLERWRPVMGGLTAAGVALTVWSAWNGGPAPYRHPMATAGLTGVALVSAGLVFAAWLGRPAWVMRMLRLPALCSAGKYSYAIYVLHYPLLDRLSRIVTERLAREDPVRGSVLWAAALAGGIGGTYVLARVSWRWLESPFLRLKTRFVPLRR